MSQPFTSIVRSGNVDTLAAAIASKKGGSLDAIDEDGFTALFLASRKAATYPMVSHLLAAGADVDLKGIDRETPLYIASFNGLLDTVKVLIKGRANVNEVNGSFKDTALHTAARLGFVDIIETLLDAGANINFRNAALETPLFVAAMAGRFEAVYCLLNRGANKTIGNAETKDPLFIASERGHKGIVELLKAEKQYLANVRGNVMHDEKAKAPPLRPTSAITAKAEQQEQQQAAAAAAAVPVPVPAPPPTKPAAVGATSSSSSSSAPRKASPAPTTKVVAPPAAAAAPSSSPKPAPAPKTPPPAPVVVQQTPVVQIDVNQPAPRTHDPLTGKKLAVCKTLVEAGYWYPPTAPEGAIKPNPELKANYGGTQMVVGTGCEPEVEVRQRPQFTPLAGDVFATVILPKGKGKVV